MKGISRMFGSQKGHTPSSSHSSSVSSHRPLSTPVSAAHDSSARRPTDWFRKFAPLNEAAHEFRLLTIYPGVPDSPIICSLTNVYLQTELPPYEVLSCTPGPGQIDWKVTVNGETFYVKEHLSAALRALRYQGKQRNLWNDVMCVNLADLAERSSQLQLKSQIFGKAQGTVIWLGPGTIKTHETFRVIERHVEASINSELAGVDWDDAYGHAMITNIAEEILDRKWWSWAPAVQDAVISPSLTIKCGSLSVSWVHFVGLLEFLKARNVESSRLLSNKHLESTNTIKTIYESGMSQSFCQLLLRSSRYECSDFRDKVSAAFGVRERLLNQLPPIASFSRSASDLQLDIVNACVHFDQSLDFLSMAGIGLSKSITTPSWLPELQEAQPTWRDRTVLAEPCYSPLTDPTSSHSTSLFSTAGQRPPVVNIATSGGKLVLTATGLAIDEIEVVPVSSLGRGTPSLLRTWEIVLSYAFGTLEAFKSLTDRWVGAMTPRILNPESKKAHFVPCMVDGNTEHCELRQELFRKARDVLLKGVPNYNLRRTRPHYASPAAFQNAYFRTILTDRDAKRERVTAAYLRASMTDLNDPSEPTAEPLLNEVLPHIPAPQRKKVFHDDFLAAVEASIQYRTLFVTKTGYIGTGPLTMRPSDLICVLFGYSVPVVLRKQSPGTYAVVGECYLAGIMDGEAFTEGWEERRSNFSIV